MLPALLGSQVQNRETRAELNYFLFCISLLVCSSGYPPKSSPHFFHRLRLWSLDFRDCNCFCRELSKSINVVFIVFITSSYCELIFAVGGAALVQSIVNEVATSWGAWFSECEYTSFVFENTG